MHTAYVSVRLGLLALLDRADMYGYQLKAEYETHTGGVWPLNIGQVYSTLDRLERDRLVATVEPSGRGRRRGAVGREQKYYAITRAGRDALAEWFEETAGDEPSAPRRAAGQGAPRPRRRARPGARRRDRASGRRSPGRWLARRRGLRDQKPAAAQAAAPPTTRDIAGELVTDALVTRAEADLRWLDLCEARLVRLAADGQARPAGPATD